MSRSARLLDLIQLLRRHRRPLSGHAIAGALGVSLRTLYRDIATLQAQGARIDGAPGLGYALRDGYLLPPLMFAADEVEAIVLGMRWVSERGDAQLAAAARDALAKIAAVLPAELRHELDTAALLVGPGSEPARVDEAAVRLAIRRQHKLRIDYRDADGRASRRLVWPFALGYFDRVQVIVAWCELRGATRHFRSDRIAALEATAERYPRSRQQLLKDWKREQGIAAADGI
ncbi:MAG: YafY family transcriptional regulator [Burkholderiales bacterium]|nr:YafY family transcriptional regulator [Burkholderiales bacterium]